MPNYYIRYNGTQYGPMPASQLVNFGLNPFSMVWREGLPEWVPAQSLPELADLIRTSATTPPPFNNPASSPIDSISDTGVSGKSRLAFGLFAILLGGLGIQYFYIDKVMGGLLCILLTLVTCGIWSVINLVQGILVMLMPQSEFERKFVFSSSTFPIF